MQVVSICTKAVAAHRWMGSVHCSVPSTRLGADFGPRGARATERERERESEKERVVHLNGNLLFTLPASAVCITSTLKSSAVHV